MSKINVKISIIVCVVCLLMIITLGVSVYALRQVEIIDSRRTLANTKKFLKDNVGEFEKILNRIDTKKKRIVLKSRYGHDIPVEYITNDNNYDKLTMVLIHGHGMTLESMYPIAEFLLDNDINVVLYDQRGHGENTAKTVTFGYYEKDDLIDVVDYVKSNMSKKNSIGVLGQSMGAATAGFYSGTEHAKDNIDFMILDCPYNNMESIVKTTAIRRGYSKIGLNLILKLGSIANKVHMKFSYSDMNVAQAVGSSSVPTLVYESRYDKTCPYYMAEEVFEGIKHKKKGKIMFNESEHIRGFYKEKDKYIRTLLDFVNKYRRDDKVNEHNS